MVAISVAMNLFAVAAFTRTDAKRVLTEVEDDIPDASLLSLSSASSQQGMQPPDGAATSVKRTTMVPVHAIIRPPRYAEVCYCFATSLVGLASVFSIPSSLTGILLMHLCPLLMLLPISFYSTAIVPQRWRGLINMSSVLAIVAAFSLVIRTRAHFEAWSQRDLLWSTFTAHPAQSSISADYICLTVSVMLEIIQAEKIRQGRHGTTAFALALVTPVLGPSFVRAAMSSVSLRSRERMEEAKIWSESDKKEDLRGQDLHATTKVTVISYSIPSPSKTPAKKRAVSGQSD
jgi:hypothetical protein